jgi:hypothetical protein
VARWTAEDPELVAYRGGGQVLYRLTDSRLTSEEDWRSHYEQGTRPRHAEIPNAMDHMGLSVWESQDHLRALHAQFGDKIGTFIVGVEINGDLGIWLAETGPEGHYTIWGRPADLQRSAHLPGVPV